ncbi:MAG: tyrosine--tRNA ligase [Turicibacter sp.]|nr:tyrosine--tRNA ligase [Turicibacter sp.]
MNNELLKDLEWRGLINDCTDATGLEKVLNEKSLSLYCGVDPTGDSMHIGHLLPFLVLKRFQNAGHKPIVLVGGATGTIGDPSGKTAERQMQTLDMVLYNVSCLQNQLSKIFGDTVTFVNNYDWTHNVSILDFLRDYGKSFNVSQMIAKDIVKSRLEVGISYTEFTYQILQAMDYNHLFENHDCQLQIGGSDQWGNIVGGLDLIRKKQGHEANAFGMTLPLITKSDGTKFGKSESGAIWLDPEKTSPYEMYQFFINTADADAIRFLKLFTFLTKEEILAIQEKFAAAPHERLAQKTLAYEVVKLIHGEAAINQAIRITEALFSGDIAALTSAEIEVGFKDVPSVVVDEDLGLIDLLVTVGAASSKREAREFITNNGISVNGQKQNELAFVVAKKAAMDEKFTVIRRGKKKYFLVKHG